MVTKNYVARNHYIDPKDGYEICRYICENAPTNRTRPLAGLDGHGYESYGVGNGEGFLWLPHIRSQHCAKCGGKMIPIDRWTPPEQKSTLEVG